MNIDSMISKAAAVLISLSKVVWHPAIADWKKGHAVVIEKRAANLAAAAGLQLTQIR